MEGKETNKEEGVEEGSDKPGVSEETEWVAGDNRGKGGKNKSG